MDVRPHNRKRTCCLAGSPPPIQWSSGSSSRSLVERRRGSPHRLTVRVATLWSVREARVRVAPIDSPHRQQQSRWARSAQPTVMNDEWIIVHIDVLIVHLTTDVACSLNRRHMHWLAIATFSRSRVQPQSALGELRGMLFYNECWLAETLYRIWHASKSTRYLGGEGWAYSSLSNIHSVARPCMCAIESHVHSTTLNGIARRAVTQRPSFARICIGHWTRVFRAGHVSLTSYLSLASEDEDTRDLHTQTGTATFFSCFTERLLAHRVPDREVWPTLSWDHQRCSTDVASEGPLVT